MPLHEVTLTATIKVTGKVMVTASSEEAAIDVATGKVENLRPEWWDEAEFEFDHDLTEITELNTGRIQDYF